MLGNVSSFASRMYSDQLNEARVIMRQLIDKKVFDDVDVKKVICPFCTEILIGGSELRLSEKKKDLVINAFKKAVEDKKTSPEDVDKIEFVKYLLDDLLAKDE